ncbi:MAG: GNAT family N-acetyltransferase [Bacteroidota bacterium]
MIRLRRGTEQDVSDIASLLIRSWQAHYQIFLPESLLSTMKVEKQVRRHRRYLKQGIHYFIAEKEHQLIGFASLGPNRSAALSAEYELYTLYVDAAFHHKGIGANLVRLVETLVPAGHKLGVWVMEPNPFRSFYEQQGFEAAGKEIMDLGETNVVNIGYVKTVSG